MSLNEMGKNAYYFSALALKDKFFIDCAKIKEDFVGLGALFFGSKTKAFRKVKMPQSIDS